MLCRVAPRTQIVEQRINSEVYLFFASCGSLFPFARANTQWVIHGFKQHFNLHFRVNYLFHYLCSQCYVAQHSNLTIRLRARVFYEQIVNEAQPS